MGFERWSQALWTRLHPVGRWWNCMMRCVVWESDRFVHSIYQISLAKSSAIREEEAGGFSNDKEVVEFSDFPCRR